MLMRVYRLKIFLDTACCKSLHGYSIQLQYGEYFHPEPVLAYYDIRCNWDLQVEIICKIHGMKCFYDKLSKGILKRLY